MSEELLGHIARAISSKNAGNFVVAIDIEFENGADLHRVLDSGALLPSALSEFLHIDIDDVLSVIPFEPGLAIKIALRRLTSSGDVGETDVFGVQQFAGFLELPIPRLKGE